MSLFAFTHRDGPCKWAGARVVGWVAIGISVQAAPTSAQTGTIVGRVVENGRPATLQVSIQDHGELGALADVAGRFSIAGVPVGEVVVLARGIGFDPGVAVVTLRPGQTAEVILETIPTHIPLSGVDHRLPHDSMTRAASSLLPGLFQVQALADVLDAFARDMMIDTPTVWVPWAETDPIEVRSGGRIVRLDPFCNGCRVGQVGTIEGEVLYVVGKPHVRIGLMTRGAGGRLLTFCIARAMAGERRFPNCAGARVRLTYARRPDGSWRRVKVD